MTRHTSSILQCRPKPGNGSNAGSKPSNNGHPSFAPGARSGAFQNGFRQSGCNLTPSLLKRTLLLSFKWSDRYQPNKCGRSEIDMECPLIQFAKHRQILKKFEESGLVAI